MSGAANEPPDRYWLDDETFLDPLDQPATPLTRERGVVIDAQGRWWRLRQRPPQWVAASMLLLLLAIVAMLIWIVVY